MIIMKSFKEAIDLSKSQLMSKDKIEDLINKDSTVIAYHGTSYYWALFLCFYGIDGDSPAPSKNLGQGNNQQGYKRIETSGLYISSIPLSSITNSLKIEVKPSELATPAEMEDKEISSGLESLLLGEAIIVKKIPAKRIISVSINDKVYSRKEFLQLEEDPKKFLNINKDNNFYQSGDLTLLRKLEKNNLYDYLKKVIKSGTEIESLINSINTMIEYKDYEARGLTLKDIEEIKTWLLSQKEK